MKKKYFMMCIVFALLIVSGFAFSSKIIFAQENKMPCILYQDYCSLDKFNMEELILSTSAQDCINEKSDKMASIDAEYRYTSINSKKLVKITDSCLVLDGSKRNDQNRNDEIVYAGKYNKNTTDYRYIVFAMKIESSEVLSDFTFYFDENNHSYSFNQLFADYDYNSLAIENNPYTLENGFFFLTIDKLASNINYNQEKTFIGLSYTGDTKVLIDEIFYTNSESNFVYQSGKYKEEKIIYDENVNQTEIEINLDTSNFDALLMDITLNANCINNDTNTFNNVVFKFDDLTFSLNQFTYLSNNNSQIFTSDFDTEKTITLKIDLKASEIQNTKKLKVVFNDSGYFNISNFVLERNTSYQNSQKIDESSKFDVFSTKLNLLVGNNEIDLSLELQDNQFSILTMQLDVIANNDFVTIQDFYNDMKTLSFAFDSNVFNFESQENSLVLINDILLKDFDFDIAHSNLLCFDLKKMGIENAENLTIYLSSSSYHFSFSNIALANTCDFYKQIVDKFQNIKVNEDSIDTIAPSVEISNIYEYTPGEVKIKVTIYDKESDTHNIAISNMKVEKIKDENENSLTSPENIVFEIVEENYTKSEDLNYFIKTFYVKINAQSGTYSLTFDCKDENNNENNTGIRTFKVCEQKSNGNHIVLFIILGIIIVAIIAIGCFVIINRQKVKKSTKSEQTVKIKLKKNKIK